MINNIKTFYPHCDSLSCHEIHNTTFYIRDVDNSKCEAVQNPNDATCCVENSNTDDIDFICIDKCVINNETIKKCDCAVIKNNVIWFIELKEVSFSGNRRLDSQKRKNGRKKAVKQLASTINDFKSKGVDLSNYLVAGLICFPPYINESNPITIPTASAQVQLLEYINLCGYSDLFEGNHIVL